MKKSLFICLSTIVLLCASCARYDSNKVNYELIQGEWLQVMIVYPDSNRLHFEKPKESTILSFADSICTETMPDLNEKRLFDYHINNFELTLTEKEFPAKILDIYKLTEDSLILQSKYYFWKYIKKAETNN